MDNNVGPNDEVAELCCNLDDMTGEALGHAFGVLLDAGAYDVFTTAIHMKKDRPGTKLSCICAVEKADFFAALMLKHTTSFGIRRTIHSRYILDRKIETVTTPLGKVRVKTGTGYGVTKSKAEYDDLAALAREHKLPISEIEGAILPFFP